MILCLKYLKNSIKLLLNTINSFTKIPRYKVNLQKSVAFPHTNNEQTEKDYKKSKIPQKNIKYLGINLSKDVKDLYKENYKTLHNKISQKKLGTEGTTNH
jgi:hypothetical protein